MGCGVEVGSLVSFSVFNGVFDENIDFDRFLFAVDGVCGGGAGLGK